jgi:hypothetical protein
LAANTPPKPPPMTRTFFLSTGEKPLPLCICRHTYAVQKPEARNHT